MRLSQAEFARAFHIKLGTVRAIEQGRRKPSGTTLTLLRVIEREPEAVRRALAGLGA
ncbi:MAG TPA: helix-turn-helix domain-containing protein [Alphaproteobacteria bacterium]|nr:helix-turn-helix domain-containing protein [Alphaproteobacteria bacterium]